MVITPAKEKVAHLPPIQARRMKAVPHPGTVKVPRPGKNIPKTVSAGIIDMDATAGSAAGLPPIQDPEP